mgnify:CR=1 FL=1
MNTTLSFKQMLLQDGYRKSYGPLTKREETHPIKHGMQNILNSLKEGSTTLIRYKHYILSSYIILLFC